MKRKHKESTKIRAWKQVYNNLALAQSVILKKMSSSKPVTRQELADKLKLPINQVCPRVNELIQYGLIFPCGEKYNKKTLKKNETLIKTSGH